MVFVTGSLIMSVLMMDSQQAISGLWETGPGRSRISPAAQGFSKSYAGQRTVGPLGYSDKEEAATSHLKQWTAERMNNLAKVF
ncbi:MAG: hypothetical protein ACOX3D_09255 [Syntrophomonadales bacterium]